ncbi:MAG: flagellar basal-body MS-ring/collar protein FliF [Gammaproteobacteria bacterium]|nr:flagellar basal-body MS-ring/collar protein FliF [Gammaproteobacteria bacterium]
MAEAITDQQAMAQPSTGTAMQGAGSANPIDTFIQSATVRHFGRLIGLAVAVAIGTVVVLWSAEPNYSPLYTNVTGQDATEIANVLTANEIKYKIDADTGTIMVAQSKAAEARLKLAAQGLPQGTTRGLEMLQQDQGMGTSQFIESARYNHALEAELSRSIESIRSVEQARVHLALPKQSIFIRNRTKPSASVMTKLFAGRRLTPGQVDAIVHMVAASIPLMEASQVTVVDQFGRLLTGDRDGEIAQTSKQFDYTRKLEDSYADRIIQLLQPIIGEGKVNAEVSASLDFSVIESTREAYDPERSVIRSEQISEQATRDLAQAMGIPGALSNQPPGTGTMEAEANETEAATAQIPSNQNRSATRNFEVDRMISHTRNPRGTIQRLSVAVLIDSKTQVKEDGTVEKVAYSDEEIQRFESLIKEAIGFDQNRGDSVSVINQSFISEEIETVEVPMWKSLLEETWVWDLAKQILGALGLLIVYLIFGRPFLKSLNPNRIEVNQKQIGTDGTEGNNDGMQQAQQMGGGMAGDVNAMPMMNEDPNNAAAMIRRSDATHEQKVDMARTLVMDDPARVANVMRQWVSEDQ